MNKPEGSKFNIENTGSGQHITWYDYSGGSRDIGGGLFLLFWLGGWIIGEVSAINQLVNGKDVGGILFLLFWLGGWTIGGFFAAKALVDSFRPSKPTKLELLKNRSIDFSQGSYEKDYIDSNGDQSTTVVKKGKKHGFFEFNGINNVLLERIGEKQRLSFDYQSQRIEIGKGLTEPEREWLYETLKRHLGVR